MTSYTHVVDTATASGYNPNIHDPDSLHTMPTKEEFGTLPDDHIRPVLSTAPSFSGVRKRTKYFRSRRVGRGEIEKPHRTKDPREKWTVIIPIAGLVLGLIVCGAIIYVKFRTTSTNTYCPVLDEDFSSGSLDPKVWTKEVELGGYGNGQFEMTTNTDENAFIQDGQLYIKPTVQDASLIDKDNVIDLRGQGCTSPLYSDCVAVTNTTNGTIVNPVKSARLNTKAGAKIRYGKVEVTAKLPQGDWMWPAIWMLPVNSTYGPWPMSGEIDIAESRGNNYTYPSGGNQVVSSTLHLGPSTDEDSWFRYYRKKNALHTTFTKGYHTFGLEWTDKYIFTYLDSKPVQILYTAFNEPFWQKGNYPPASGNGTQYLDPWGQTGEDSTPFDQEFYLILNVAVGSTNAWFADGVASKPWVDADTSAPHDFWNARDQWAPTWEKNGQMIVKSVKIWQLKGFNGC